MSLYSNNSVNVRMCYSFTDHYLKAKLFTWVLSMYRKASNSNYVGNKMLCNRAFFGSKIIYWVAFINKYEKIELKSGSGKSWGFSPVRKQFKSGLVLLCVIWKQLRNLHDSHKHLLVHH